MPTYLYVCDECQAKYYKHFKSHKNRTDSEQCSRCNGVMPRQISKPMTISRYKDLESRRKKGEGYMVDQQGNMLELIAKDDNDNKKEAKRKHQEQAKEAEIKRRFGEKPKPLPTPKDSLSAPMPEGISLNNN